jgi:hypothetical protein
MGTNVYANGLEIAGKASSGKSVAQFPDVCFTPPTAPPTPSGVPVPYPNTAMASDCENGSTRVQIGGKEVMLKNKSYIASSKGNEAGGAPQKNILTHTNRGKAYFTAWSMNVRIEGENVPRHLDPMTHNHASQPGDGTPWVYMSVQAPATGTSAMARCRLVRYADGCEGTGSKKMTPHHCVPDHCFKDPGKFGGYYPGAIKHRDGLCICVEGSDKYKQDRTGASISHWSYETFSQHYHALAEHGRIHAKFDELESALGRGGKPGGSASLGQLESTAAKVIAEVTGCDEKALKKQLRAYHSERGLPANTKLRADPNNTLQTPPRNGMGVQRNRSPGGG